MSDTECRIANGSALALRDAPVVPFAELRSLVLEKVAGGSRVAALCPIKPDGDTVLLALLTHPDSPELTVATAKIGDAFPSLTPECPEVHLFEREIAEDWGIVPQGHPWLKPVRFHEPPANGANAQLPKWFDGKHGPSVMEFFRVEGEEVHEVAVGPVHAGVIEPGHFRFQCHGEKVMFLEISLGYQHRRIEKALIGGPAPLTRHYMETLAGDTTCGHTWAYAMIAEALTGTVPTAAADRIRGIGLELERIAHHVGDLGALAGDVGFLPTSSYCGQLRGDILNLTGLLCGNRFSRGLIVPGGVAHRLDGAMAATMSTRLAAAIRGIHGAVELMFHKPSVLARFEDTGKVDTLTAERLGLVGPAARASGLAVDARLDQPFGPYRPDLFPIRVGHNGDVMDRAKMRLWEIDASAKMIDNWLQSDLTTQPSAAGRLPALRPDSLAVALTEGWRGRVCHVATTGPDGRFTQYKVVDPSFHNWPGLAMALRGQQISDFPLCNKSFNLSYCGHDL